MRRDRELDVALPQGFINKINLEIFKVADAPVNELGGLTRGTAREVAFFQKRHLHAALGREMRDGGPVDPAAHDEQIISIFFKLFYVSLHNAFP